MPDNQLDQMAHEARHAIRDYFKKVGEYKRIYIDGHSIVFEAYDGMILRMSARLNVTEHEAEEMATRSKRHNHRYYRMKLPNSTIVWACAEGDCLHHMPVHYTPMMLHKNFYCWQCGEIDRIREEHLKDNARYFSQDLDKKGFLSHPICFNCANNIPILSDEEINNQIIQSSESESNHSESNQSESNQDKINPETLKYINSLNFKLRR